MNPSEESVGIVSAFKQYQETGNKSLINNISEDKLELALLQHPYDNVHPHYRLMERRLKELKDIRNAKRNRKEKLQDMFLGFLSGILASLSSTYLKNLWN